MIKPLAEQYQDKERSAKEFVFLHANGKGLIVMRVAENVMEKSLGEGEKVSVRREAIVGYSAGIKMGKSIGIGANHVTVEGPGILIVETGLQDDGLWAQLFYRRHLTR